MSDERLLAALKALKEGDLSVRLPETETGTAGEIAITFNAHMDQINELVREINRISNEIGVQGRFGGQAQVEGLSGAWDDLQKNVNQMDFSLTDQVRNIAMTVDLLLNNGRLSQPVTYTDNEIACLRLSIAQLASVISERA